MNKKWWIIGGLIVVGAGVGAYFLFRKPKDENKDEEKDEEKVEETDSPSGSPSLGRPNTSSAITCTGSYPSTPFSSKAEGDAFRKWVNANFPAYAKEIDLSKTGEFNNCFIKKAYDKYGKAYSFALVPTMIGKDYAKLSSCISTNDCYKVSLPKSNITANFYNNGRVFFRKTGLGEKKGGYVQGGNKIRLDNGVVSQKSAIENLQALV
jgi:hypothetical protein